MSQTNHRHIGAETRLIVHVYYRRRRRRRRFRIVCCVGAHRLFSTLSRRGLNPIKLAYSPSPPDNGLGQYASSPRNRAYCYAEHAVSSLAMAVIIASTHFAYPWRDGQAELACLL